MDRYAAVDRRVGEARAQTSQRITISAGALVLLVGSAGSGKTTFALDHFPLECIVGTDMLRAEVSNNPQNQVVSDDAFALAGGIVKERLLRKRTTVVDAKNIDRNSRHSFLRIARACGAPIVAIMLDVSLERCLAFDRTRRRQVGERVLRQDALMLERALYALCAEEDITVHRLDEQSAKTVTVHLEDAVVYRAVPYWFSSEVVRDHYLGVFEVGVKPREHGIGYYVAIAEGGVLLLEHDNPSSQSFLRRNFIPSQVVDVRAIATRLGVDALDDAVVEYVRRLLSMRVRLNLVSVVSVPCEYARTEDITQCMSKMQEKRGHTIPVTRIREGIGAGDKLSSALVIVKRPALSDEPLLIVGDVQGCLNALRHLVQSVRKENKKRARYGQPPRRIVLVGDMADRGTADAGTVYYCVTDLFKDGKAVLVRGNHDENLLKGLRGEDSGTKETARTVSELKEMCDPDMCDHIASVIEAMPYVLRFESVTIAHATLECMPREGKVLSARMINDMTHGVGTGRKVGGRREIWNLVTSSAKDPDMLVVSGHTHEREPVVNGVAGGIVLDAGVEMRGKLFALRWPEMTLHHAYEPGIAKLYRLLRGSQLPSSPQVLRAFVDYCALNGHVIVKRGTGDYKGLCIVSYSEMTEAGNTWDRYPVLRHFRGLIIDEAGNIIARPFPKTHKSGIEVPLARLAVVPKRVLEKVNGTLIILFHWNGAWRVSTKFCLKNEYTQAAEELLSGADLSKLDSRKTHLFELVLPEDPHIVDYRGEKSLVLLNAVNTASGRFATWKYVEKSAAALDVRTAKDVTRLWPRGTTIADMYRGAQMPGIFKNVEGFMAVYEDANGRDCMVKIKVRTYDDKKFVRDMGWKHLLRSFDYGALDVSLDERLQLLWCNVGNIEVRAMLEERITWIRETYRAIIRRSEEIVHEPLAAVRAFVHMHGYAGDTGTVSEGLRSCIPVLVERLHEQIPGFSKHVFDAHMGFIRSSLSGKGSPRDAIHKYAVRQIEHIVEEETKRHGECAFWIVPEVKI